MLVIPNSLLKVNGMDALEEWMLNWKPTSSATHWMMREAIQQYIEREEKLETFRQDGIRAWNEYQTTGLHVTLEEADAWLGKLETGQDAEPPECHA